MVEINQNGRDELERAYRLANEGDHNNMRVYVERVDGLESNCEIYSEGTVYVEHPDGYTADMIPAVEMSEDEFMERAKRIIEK